MLHTIKNIGHLILIKKYGLLVCLFFSVFLSAFPQTDRSTKNNYTGDWATPTSWEPAWDTPQTNGIDFNVFINGYISCRESLAIIGNTNSLTINDTLIVCGDLELGNNSSLVINPNGILFVFGDLVTDNKSIITINTNAYIVVTGDYIKNGVGNDGSFISNNRPTNVFIGGAVPAGIDLSMFPVLSCPGGSPYNNSQCSYGNMLDIVNDPINTFFQEVCSPSVPIITSSGSLRFCDGDSITLTSSEATNYLWSTGATTASISVNTAGNYTVSVSNGCSSLTSATTMVTVDTLPDAVIAISDNSGLANNDGIICDGATAMLVASGGERYTWSSGDTTAEIMVETSGIYIVVVTDTNGCTNTKDTIILVNDLPTALISITDNSGITNNDGIICEGATATLTASGGESYDWSSGETSADIGADTPGTYTVTVADTNGCFNTAYTTIMTIANPEVNAGSGGDVCGDVFTLNASLTAGTGAWSVTSGDGDVTFSPDENNPAATISISSYGSYQLTWTVIDQYCPASSDITITFHEIPVANAGTNQELNTNETVMEADLSSSETGEWSLFAGAGIIEDSNSPVSPVNGLLQGDNIFLWTVSTVYCSASDSVVISVNFTNELWAPEVITPNGDGKNDFFVIDRTANNAPIELVIINRWGEVVYDNSDYQNNWRGEYKDTAIELSNDTYFYTVKQAGDITNGFVVIKK